MRIKTIEHSVKAVKSYTKINYCSAASNPTMNNFSNMYTVKMSLIVTSGMISQKLYCRINQGIINGCRNVPFQQ